MIYVRRAKSKRGRAGDTWHFSANCSSLPRVKEYLEVPFGERPKTGELCNFCLAHERRSTGVPLERPA